METIAVLVPTKLSLDEVGASLEPLRGRKNGDQWTVERDGVAIFLGLLSPDHTDVDSVRNALPWRPETALLITIGHGANQLAFEVADRVSQQWHAVVDWGSMDWLKNLYDKWKQLA